MKKYLFILFFCFIFDKVQPIETRIIYNISNEIITNIDIKNEFKYLMALNTKLKELDKEKILEISNESIIKEKIKKIEISKNFKEIKINSEYLDILLKNLYLRLGLQSKNEFNLYLQGYDLTLKEVKRKITIDTLWNELIIKKYSSQIFINRDQIRKKISKNSNTQIKEYKLSEIIFEIKNKKEIQVKYEEIVESIDKKGFSNSAAIYSFSESAKIGGDIGWINENSLNNAIKKNIKNLNINEISKPIVLSNGILILKLTNTKISDVNIDAEEEFKKAINYERNRQLNQYSKIYYNKIKKNLELDD